MISFFPSISISFAILATTSIHSVNAEGLRGKSTRNLQSNRGDSNIIAALPSGFYDESQVTNPFFTIDLKSKCNSWANAGNLTKGESLGCQLLFEPYQQAPQLIMGTVKIDKNLFDLNQLEGYNRDDITMFYEDYALATMIENRCFNLDTSANFEVEHQTVFSDIQSYSLELNRNHGFGMKTQASGFGVQVTAGYNTQSQSYTGNSGTNRFAYGQNMIFSSIGVLSNDCLVNPELFDAVIKEKNLISNTWVQRWETVKNATDPQSLYTNQDFIEIAEGGLLTPSSFAYGAAVKYTIKSEYRVHNSKSSNDMSNAISAGLSFKFDGIGGGVSTSIKNAVDKSASSTNIVQKSQVEVMSLGYNVSTSCIAAGSCSSDVLKAAEESIRDNLGSIGNPWNQGGYIDLDTIVTMYTGSPLGSTFDEAINNYFTYTQCDDVYTLTDTHFTTYSGDGTKISSLSGECSIPKNEFFFCTQTYYDSFEKSMNQIKDDVCFNPLEVFLKH